MSARQYKWFSHVTHLKCPMFQGAFLSVMLQQRASPVEHPVPYGPAWVRKKIPSNEEVPCHNFTPMRTWDGGLLFLIFIICGELRIINHKNPWLKEHNHGATSFNLEHLKFYEVRFRLPQYFKE